MKTLANPKDKQDTLVRLAKARLDRQARRGRMPAHETGLQVERASNFWKMAPHYPMPAAIRCVI